MNKELVQKWIEILPSYKFHHTWLRTFNDEFNPEGVLCDIIDNTSWGVRESDHYYFYIPRHEIFAPSFIIKQLGISQTQRNFIQEVFVLQATNHQRISDMIKEYLGV